MMDMTFCVLWIKENRKLSLYHQNQELGVISKSRLSSKMWQYRAFQSHNKKRNKKTSTAHCLNNVLVLSTGSSPLLSSPILKIVLLSAFSWLMANLKTSRRNNWGPSTLGQSLKMPSLLFSAKKKQLVQQGCGPPCLRSSNIYV